MNWYSQVKTAFLKMADPHKELDCSSCGQSFLTDLFWEDPSRRNYQVVSHDGRNMSREDFEQSPHLARYEASKESLKCPHCGVEKLYSFKRPVGHCSPEVENCNDSQKQNFTFPQSKNPMIVA